MGAGGQRGLRGDPAAESALRRELRAGAGLIVLTGGQTGVDSYAAQAALRAGLRLHLVFPKGYRQEDGTLTAARRDALSGAALHELRSPSYRYRTWTCVYLSDVVLLLDPAGGAGCEETARAAHALGRPLLRPEVGSLTAAQTATWLAGNEAKVLMVAGCRASMLARQPATADDRELRDQVDVLMAGARQRDKELRCPTQ